MGKNILIIGSGFAGMWAAVSAARLAELNDCRYLHITLLAPRPELRIRPRFYEDNVISMVTSLEPLFAVTGVNFLAGTVERIDTNNKMVCYTDAQGNMSSSAYDRLVLATGSHTKPVPIVGAKEYAFNIDQLESAQRFEKHLLTLSQQPSSEARNTVVICGGGFTGIELATELPSRLMALFGADTKIKIIVVDRGSEIGKHYSKEMQDVIKQASDALGIEWRINTEIAAIDATGVTLSDGHHIASSSVVWTAGVQANGLTGQIDAKRDTLGRLYVNENLQVHGFPDIYATGDVANAATDNVGNTALMTCQHAIQLGKFAGNNVAASVLGIPPLTYRQETYVTCLDLGKYGAVFTEGWEQKVTSVGDEAKKIKISITHELIYPPKAERSSAFAAADPLAHFV